MLSDIFKKVNNCRYINNMTMMIKIIKKTQFEINNKKIENIYVYIYIYIIFI